MKIKIKANSNGSKDPYGLFEFRPAEDRATSWYEPSPLEIDGFKGVPPSLEPDYQQPAADAKGSVMLIASPGSGKTRVALAKCVQLYNDKTPFLALMYTRKAAEELRSRLSSNGNILRSRIGTIHSFCLAEIRRNYPGYRVKGTDKFGKLLADFLDLEIKPKYPYIVVDEMQDVSELENKVLESVRGGYIFGVGDPYQSIYGFAGALGEEAFEYFPAKIMELKYNYRSNQEVIDGYEEVFPRGIKSRGHGTIENFAVLTRNNKDADYAYRYLQHAGFGCVRIYPGTGDKGDIVSVGDGSIYVMTIHCSKATEYREVYVCLDGWWQREGGSFPLSEDYILYVGLSRGMTYSRIISNIDMLVEEWEDMENDNKEMDKASNS